MKKIKLIAVALPFLTIFSLNVFAMDLKNNNLNNNPSEETNKNIPNNNTEENKINYANDDAINNSKKETIKFNKKDDIFKSVNKKLTEKDLLKRKQIMNKITHKKNKLNKKFSIDGLNTFETIFNDSVLLDYKLNDDIDFFNSEVRKNGVNSYKSVKYIKFIEKLYKLIQRAFQRMTINSTAMLYENQHDILIERQQDKILRLNQMKMLEKEIKFDKKEIEKLKKKKKLKIQIKVKKKKILMKILRLITKILMKKLKLILMVLLMKKLILIIILLMKIIMIIILMKKK